MNILRLLDFTSYLWTDFSFVSFLSTIVGKTFPMPNCREIARAIPILSYSYSYFFGSFYKAIRLHNRSINTCSVILCHYLTPGTSN